MMIRESEQVVRLVKRCENADEANNLSKLGETVKELDDKVLLGVARNNRAFDLMLLRARTSDLRKEVNELF